MSRRGEPIFEQDARGIDAQRLQNIESRCSFCRLCAEACPTKAIKALIMSEDRELGSYSRETQILRIDQMYDGLPIEMYTR